MALLYFKNCNNIAEAFDMKEKLAKCFEANKLIDKTEKLDPYFIS